MDNLNLIKSINELKANVAAENTLVFKELYIGKVSPLEGVLVYSDTIVNKDRIDNDVLKPLMLYLDEDVSETPKILQYIVKRTLTMSNTKVSEDFQELSDALKRGKSVLMIGDAKGGIIIDTTMFTYRSITTPTISPSITGAKEDFTESLETNISIIKRRVKDKNLVIDKFVVGTRSQTDGVIIYISDVIDHKIVTGLKEKISRIDIDSLSSTDVLMQHLEEYHFMLGPQYYSTDSAEKSASKLMEGKALMFLEGSPYSLSAPATFFEFYQSIDDYNERSLIASFSRLLRVLAAFLVVTLSPLYLNFLKYNPDFMHEAFIEPIAKSRVGIPLSPFLEILMMETVIEFIREGGLRLPTKVGSTLSIVGGIIIGDAAINAKIVSPTTLLVVGVSAVSTFLFPNYQMSLSIRLLRFVMLVLTNILGILGIAGTWFVLVVIYCGMENFGVEYLEFKKADMKDIFVRLPYTNAHRRPEIHNTTDKVKQNNKKTK